MICSFRQLLHIRWLVSDQDQNRWKWSNAWQWHHDQSVAIATRWVHFNPMTVLESGPGWLDREIEGCMKNQLAVTPLAPCAWIQDKHHLRLVSMNLRALVHCSSQLNWVLQVWHNAMWKNIDASLALSLRPKHTYTQNNSRQEYKESSEQRNPTNYIDKYTLHSTPFLSFPTQACACMHKCANTHTHTQYDWNWDHVL